MRQEREQPVSKHEGLNANLLRKLGRVEFIGVPPFSLPKDDGREEELRETRLALRRKDRRDNGEEQPSQRENGQNPDGFEPFLNQDQQEGNLFENIYRGNFSHDMLLNRSAVERVLQIAHLNGKVFLTNFQQSRSRSEAQGNELVAKRFGIFDRRAKKPEEENPYKRVVSVPEGWRIEINDQRITEELGQKLTGEELKRAFIERFNAELRGGLMECVWREKCSSEKDVEKSDFKHKFLTSIIIPASLFSFDALTIGINLKSSLSNLGGTCVAYGLLNIRGKNHENFKRKTDNPLEHILPLIEIDKVGRTFAYLAGKGRTLVREAENK